MPTSDSHTNVVDLFPDKVGPVAFAASVIERLWRSLKYEAVYLHEIADGLTARPVIADWIGVYNTIRPHTTLGGRTPAEANACIRRGLRIR